MEDSKLSRASQLRIILRLARLYSVIALATIGALIIFSIAKPSLINKDAWVHAIIVGVFAVVLPLRARAALRGKHSALRATGIISAVLFLVNVVEGLLPNFMPLWIRVSMFLIATIMIFIVGLVINISVKRND